MLELKEMPWMDADEVAAWCAVRGYPTAGRTDFRKCVRDVMWGASMHRHMLKLPS